VKGRAPLLHFKDYSIVNREPAFSEVGEGNLDWPEILKAADEAGSRWYIFEQDHPLPYREMMESIKITYQNMKGLGIQ